MPPRAGAARVKAAMLWLAVSAVLVASTPVPTAIGAPSAPVRATLAFADGADRLVPGDGVASTTVVAAATDPAGRAVAGWPLVLRPLERASGATVTTPRQLTAADGTASFTLSGARPGRVIFGLFDGRSSVGSEPLARLRVDFTRKVVVLAPGFGSALADRFTIFGSPQPCTDPAMAGSVYAALTCLGYSADAALDRSIAGSTIVDTSWNSTRCRPADVNGAPDCIATIYRSADGKDVHWQPADYDLRSIALGMGRQAEIDRWAERLARTMATYDSELYATAGIRASFYLLGHSLGGQLGVRVLHVLGNSTLGAAFSGAQRGLLQALVSVDGALNWSGAIALLSTGPHCGLPVQTVADPVRLFENVAAVELGHDLFGTQTVAVTSAADGIVGPAVALLGAAGTPRRGYREAVFHLEQAGAPTAECRHSTLLWPEEGAAVRYPLADILGGDIGFAAGARATTNGPIGASFARRLFFFARA